MRIAITNEYGGIDRTVDITDDTVEWQYAYPITTRAESPATRDQVRVKMADGSWCNGKIVTDCDNADVEHPGFPCAHPTNDPNDATNAVRTAIQIAVESVIDHPEGFTSGTRRDVRDAGNAFGIAAFYMDMLRETLEGFGDV